MDKKFYKNEKFQAVFFPVLYFGLSVALVITGCYIFKKKYYQPVIVDGKSMLPTLAGGTAADQPIVINGVSYPARYRYHYGIADLHEHSVNNIKRFDVIVTHYPTSWGTSDETYIIKRVWGFPGETINLTYDSEAASFTFSVYKNNKNTYKITAPIVNYQTKFESECVVDGKYHFSKSTCTMQAAKFILKNKTFYTAFNPGRHFTNHQLGKNEYFVMGDNWNASSDSFVNINKEEKLTKKYLQGRVLYMSAYASLVKDDPKYIHEFKKRYNF